MSWPKGEGVSRLLVLQDIVIRVKKNTEGRMIFVKLPGAEEVQEIPFDPHLNAIRYVVQPLLELGAVFDFVHQIFVPTSEYFAGGKTFLDTYEEFVKEHVREPVTLALTDFLALEEEGGCYLVTGAKGKGLQILIAQGGVETTDGVLVGASCLLGIRNAIASITVEQLRATLAGKGVTPVVEEGVVQEAPSWADSELEAWEAQKVEQQNLEVVKTEEEARVNKKYEEDLLLFLVSNDRNTNQEKAPFLYYTRDVIESETFDKYVDGLTAEGLKQIKDNYKGMSANTAAKKLGAELRKSSTEQEGLTLTQLINISASHITKFTLLRSINEVSMATYNGQKRDPRALAVGYLCSRKGCLKVQVNGKYIFST